VETMKTSINILCTLDCATYALRSAHSVVKFIVNVRLMEKRVKSHVGRVIVVKVMIQYRVPGSTRRTVRMTRARTPRVDGDCSAAWKAATADGMASVEVGRAVGELLAIELTELRASAAAMVFVQRKWMTRGAQRSGWALFEVAMAEERMQRRNTHGEWWKRKLGVPGIEPASSTCP